MADKWKSIDADPPASEFFDRVWEKRPAVFKASPQRKALFSGLFGLRQLLVAAEGGAAAGDPLLFGADVNAARYVAGVRETPNEQEADPAALQRLFGQEGCTLQVHQPQRFDDSLWRLCAALEARLGCLVGCNAYVTPPGKQGLAPHWDDVDILVLQTQGAKAWKVYTPTSGPHAGCALANYPSGDLDEEDLGAPALEVTLQVGDVLYLPRGTVHQAVAAGAQHSSHLTLSTYQRWTWGDLGQYAASVVLADPAMQRHLPAAAKAGLPRGFLFDVAIDAAAAEALAAAAGGVAPAPANRGKGSAPSAESARQGLAGELAAVFRGLADFLENKDGAGAEAVGAAADAMAEDFMRSRLPPHPAQLLAQGAPPEAGDFIQCRGARFFRIVPLLDGAGGGCDDIDCDEDHDHDHGHGHQDPGAPGAAPAFVRLISCLRNERETHMLGHDSDSGSDDSGSESGSDSEEDGSEGEELDWVADAQMEAARAVRAAVPQSEEEESDEEGSEEEDDGEDAQEDLVFPAEFAPALLQVLGAGVSAVAVADLALPLAELKVQVAQALWEAGAVATVAPPAAAAASAKRAQKTKGADGKQKKAKTAK